MRDDLRADRAPQMVHSVRSADFLGIVKRCGTVSIGENKDVRWRKDLQRGFKSGADEIGRFVAGDQKRGILDIILDLGLGSVLRWRRIVLENNEKWGKGIAKDLSVHQNI